MRSSGWHYLIMPTQFTHLFNMKLIQYENGVTELRTYSDVMGNKPVNMPDELLICKQLIARANNRLKEHTFYNPFLELEMGLYDLDEIEEHDRRKRYALRNSYCRTVQSIYAYARQCKWEYFITLTYSKEKCDRYDFSACMKLACKWFMNQRNRYAEDMQYLIVPEQHKDGAWHVHGLIANCGAMKFVDSGHKYGDRPIYNLDGWENGFSTAVQVVDTWKISGYITKYITKDLCASTEGKRRYYRSRNIPEPTETEFLVEGNQKDAFAEMLADSLGVNKVYEKEIAGYTSVNYKYFQSEVET